MDELLFYSQRRELRDWLDERRRSASAAVDRIDPDRVLSLPLSDLVDEVFEEHMIEEPGIDLEGRYTPGAQDTKIDVTGDFRYGQRLDGGQTYAEGTQVSVRVPVRGPGEAFKTAASKRTFNPPRGRIEGRELIVTFNVPSHKLESEQERERFKDELERTLERLAELVAWARSDIAAFNAQLRVDLEAGIVRRKRKVLADRNLDAFLGIPMTPRANPPAVGVPLKTRRALKAQATGAGAMKPYEPEPALSATQIEEIVRTIAKWSEGPERLPKTFASMGEEAIRDSLLIVLNGTFEWAGSEVFRRNGKTDISILVSGAQESIGAAFVAELKFWRGKAAFPKAVNQLLGYSLWRDSVCALVLLIRNKNATAVIDQALEILESDVRCKRTAEPIAGRSVFMFEHPVDASKELAVVLLPVVVATGDEE